MQQKLTFAEWLCYSLRRKRSKARRTASMSWESRIAFQESKWQTFWQRIGKSPPDFEGKTVVDYGCGEGFDSLFMLRRGAKHVYCLEISKARLEAAKEMHRDQGFENVSYIDNTDVSNLCKKIGRASVDIVCCRDVMEHVPDPLAVLQSIYDVLPGGGGGPVYWLLSDIQESIRRARQKQVGHSMDSLDVFGRDRDQCTEEKVQLFTDRNALP